MVWRLVVIPVALDVITFLLHIVHSFRLGARNVHTIEGWGTRAKGSKGLTMLRAALAAGSRCAGQCWKMGLR